MRTGQILPRNSACSRNTPLRPALTFRGRVFLCRNPVARVGSAAPPERGAQLVKKVLTSWWTGKQAPPPLPPSPVSAKNQRFFGRGACKETIFSLENEIYKNRPVPTLYICTAFLMEKRQQVEPGTARSKGLRPSRALQVFNKLSAPGRTGGALHLCVYVLFTTARRMLPGPSFAARRWIRSTPQCRSSST